MTLPDASRRWRLAGRGASRTRPARNGAIGHRRHRDPLATETRSHRARPKFSVSPCLRGVLSVSPLAHFSVSRSPWEEFCHGLLGDPRLYQIATLASLLAY